MASAMKSNAWTTESSGDLEAFGGSGKIKGPLIPDGKPKGGCSAFCGCLANIWGTAKLAGQKNREIYVKTTLRELIVYILFLFVLCVLTFGMSSPNTFFMSQVMANTFIGSTFPDNRTTYKDIANLNDVWIFLEEVAVPNLFPDSFYNGAPLPENEHFILYENKLLGYPRLRQVRVRNDSCQVPDDFKGAINACYNMYSADFEDKSTFGTGNDKSPDAWRYQSEKELDNMQHWGLLATYSGSGSVRDLNSTTADGNKKIIEDLKQNLWIRRGTRAVFLDFTVYNANINLFSVIKLVMEMPATGGVFPTYTIRTLKLLRYVSSMDYFVLACEIIFCFFVFYYIIEELLEIYQLRCAYLKSVWNYVDILLIVLSFALIYFTIYSTLHIDLVLTDLLKDPDDFPDFDDLGFFNNIFNNATAFTVFVAWIKVFKYISFNKTMTQLSSTLSRCSKDVGGFSVMFGIVFFAYAQLGYLLFGTQDPRFSSFGNAVFSLLRTILGDFDFEAIQHANRLLGPLFFITYVFFVFFVLLNMFLAIINDTYSEVKGEISRQKGEFEIGDLFKRSYHNFLGILGKRDRVFDLQNAMKLAEADGDGRLSFEEIRSNLKKSNFSDVEIEMVFSKYDTDHNRSLDSNEARRMLAELDGEKTQLEAEEPKPAESEENNSDKAERASSAGSGVTQQQFVVIQRRVDRLEHVIGSIVAKIDAVLMRLEGMEKNKSKRRDTMNKILDTITEDGSTDDAQKRAQMEKLVRDELDDDWDTDPSVPGSTPRPPRSSRH